MRILITGYDGFIGKNLRFRLKEYGHSILSYGRKDSYDLLKKNILKADFIFHLAGENRSKRVSDFELNNTQLTNSLANVLEEKNLSTPIVFSSSIQVDQSNSYGISKLKSEEVLKKLFKKNKNSIYIYRLANVFGKWSKPNYNSVIATFCHNISRNIEIKIDNKNKILKLIYIDDLIDDFIEIINKKKIGSFEIIQPDFYYEASLNKISKTIYSFENNRLDLNIESVGSGFLRALYATYISFLPKEKFVYKVPEYSDERGVFKEFVKTHNSGQLSCFSSMPGVARGKHYHNTKVEKFFIIQGKAKFRFKNIVSNDVIEIITTSNDNSIIETIPGWAHEIINIGKEIMHVMLWSSENFDKEKPDTYQHDV